MSNLPERHDPFKFEDIVDGKDIELSDIGGRRAPVVVQKNYTKELLKKALAVTGQAQGVPGAMIDQMVDVAMEMNPDGEFRAESDVVAREGSEFGGRQMWHDQRLLTTISPMGQGLYDIMERFPCHREQEIDIMYEIAEERPDQILDNLLMPGESAIDGVIAKIEENGAVIARNKMNFHFEGDPMLLQLMGNEYQVEMAFAVTENESFVIIEDYVAGRPAAHSVYRWQGGAAYWKNAPEAEVDQMRRLINRNRPFYNMVEMSMQPGAMQPTVRIKETPFDLEPEEDMDGPRMGGM